MMAQNYPSSQRRRVRGCCYHPLLPVALAFLTLNEVSLSLILPSHHFLSRQHSSTQQYQYCYRRRKRSSQLQFSSTQENAHLINPNSLLQNSWNSYHDERRNDNALPGGRLLTSLFMTQNSESTGGGFGKGEDKKKKGNNKGNHHNNPKNSNNPRPKANKSVAKGTSSSSGNDNGDASDKPPKPKGKTKRTRRRNNNNKTNTIKKPKHKKQTSKSKNNNKGGRANKTKATSNHGASVLNTAKSSIKTNDENTSLKGFKSSSSSSGSSSTARSPKSSTQQPQQQTAVGVNTNSAKAKDGAEGDDNIISDGDLQKRVVQLEMIVSNQMMEIQKLRREIEDLTKAASVFSNVVDVLREAGLKIDEEEDVVAIEDDDENEDDGNGKDVVASTSERPLEQQTTSFQVQDDMEIFGIAPKSVTDAADAAGASVLAAILAGKHRMLVDVRDAELTRDPKLFVEFIELAILPVAAGLEGLDDGDEYVRNRVKIVFPTVKELMSYRRSMALAAPEVVSLSTLGFDPVDERDNLIVVIAPSPDDMAGVIAVEKLLARTDQNYVEPDMRITQPVVVLNHHMVPIDMAGFGKFTVVYHLRLLSVQYMTGDATPEYVKERFAASKSKEGNENTEGVSSENDKQNSTSTGALANEGGALSKAPASDRSDEEEAALEAAMTHAHEIGVHEGVTRAMVIRAYPKPWHVFVDTSPDTDAEFEAAATFDNEPTQEDVNYAIVECLEGSEREDEIVAQQMQEALEAGQLNRVSDMLGISPSDMIVPDDGSKKAASAEETNDDISSGDDDGPFGDGNDWDDLYYDDWFSEDSV